MSRIAFNGNALGTGTVTIASPNTNSDRTVTLPDETGTIVLSGGALGTPSSGNGSNLTNLNASNLASGTVPDARFPATLPAASGANLTSLNASNLASGTVGTARLATSGTASSSTYLRGDQTWAAVAGYSGPLAPQVFTSSGTFTVPAGITSIRAQVYGAGGGSSRNAPGGTGGLGDAIITGLTPGATVSVTIGTGGNGGSGTGAGSTGGTSSFGTYISATGGGGGTWNSSTGGQRGANGTATYSGVTARLGPNFGNLFANEGSGGNTGNPCAGVGGTGGGAGFSGGGGGGGFSASGGAGGASVLGNNGSSGGNGPGGAGGSPGGSGGSQSGSVAGNGGGGGGGVVIFF